MSRSRGQRVSDDRVSRYEHNDYLESPQKLERQLAEGLERTRARLEQQRQELLRRALMRCPRS
jgi:hypothetical protein